MADETTHPEAFRLVQRLMARIQEDGGVVHVSSMVEEIVDSGWRPPNPAAWLGNVDFGRVGIYGVETVAKPVPEATKRCLGLPE